jgi:hypothetical protein
MTHPEGCTLGVVMTRGEPDMPSTHTPRQTIRVDADLWADFGEVAQPDRSAVLREFMRWYTWKPGVKMPRRTKPE